MLAACTLSFNARAGASAAGCLGAESVVTLADNTLDSDKLALVVATLKIAGCLPQSAPMLPDAGGNSCDGGACTAAPVGDLAPIPTSPP